MSSLHTHLREAVDAAILYRFYFVTAYPRTSKRAWLRTALVATRRPPGVRSRQRSLALALPWSKRICLSARLPWRQDLRALSNSHERSPTSKVRLRAAFAERRVRRARLQTQAGYWPSACAAARPQSIRADVISYSFNMGASAVPTALAAHAAIEPHVNACLAPPHWALSPGARLSTTRSDEEGQQSPKSENQRRSAP
jgi:hypothetical protein